MIKLRDNVLILNNDENGGLIYNQQNEKVYSYDNIGVEVISLLQEGTIFDEMVSKMINTFDVKKDLLVKDLKDFIDFLLEEELIDVNE